MAQQTILSSDTVEDALLTKSDDNFDELYDIKAEVEAARNGESDLLTKIEALESAINVLVAGGGILVSDNDTTAKNLEDAFTVVGGLSLSTLNDGANETRVLTESPTVTAKTGDYVLTAADLTGSSTFINTGATAEINFTWPTLSAGQECEFEVTAAYYLKVTAPATKVFTFKGVDGASAGYIRANTPGTIFRVRCNGTKLTITKIIGVVKYDE